MPINIHAAVCCEIDSFRFVQQIHGPTQKAGHILDLIIHADHQFVFNPSIYNPSLSDHLATHFTVSFPNPTHENLYYRPPPTPP